MNAKQRPAWPWAALAACVLLAGCGKADRSCPATGKVIVNGKPAAGLYVTLLPAESNGRQNQSPAAARTEKDGTFSLRVPEPGEYTVTAFWPTVTLEQGEQVEGEDAFRGRFRDPQRPALKVTIARGENALPLIELKFDFSKP